MAHKTLFATFCTTLLLLTSCQNQTPSPAESPVEGTNQSSELNTNQEMESDSAFVHTVFFWFKAGVTADQRAKFEVELGKLATCPTIDKVWSGKPAGTPRDVVDNSYDYSWIVHFKNREDQDAYQVEPIHLAFIEACKEYWDRVQVYDSMVKKL